MTEIILAARRAGFADGVKRLVLMLLLVLPLSAAPSPFLEADRAFDRGSLAEAGRLYEGLMGVDRARALEGLASVYLAQGQVDRFQSAWKEAEGLRRRLPESPPGGFEHGLSPPWGTGHWEHPGGSFRFGIWWNSGKARTFARMDSAVAHSGQASLRITSYSPSAPHVFGTTGQRIERVHPNTLYEVSLWARAEDLTPGAVQVVLDPAWHVRPLTLPPGSYDWRRFTAQVNSGDLAFIDLRLLIQSTGTVWIDDLSLRTVEVATDPLLEAEALLRRGLVREALERLRGMDQTSPGVRLRLAEALAALGDYGPALELYEGLSGPTSFGVWMEMGQIYLDLDQPEKALEHFRNVRAKTPDDQAMQAEAGDRMALALMRLGRFDEALASEGVALRILQHINDPHGRATALCHLARIHRAAGQPELARRPLETALPLALAVEDRKLQSDLLTERGALTGSLPDLQEAVTLRRAICDRYGLIFSLYWLGRAQARQGDRRAALASLEEAVEILESVQHSRGLAQRGGESLLRSGEPIYEELIRLYLEDGRREEALDALARSRGEGLRRLFQEQSPALEGERRQMMETGRSLQGEQEALERRLQHELSKPVGQQDAASVEEARREREKRLAEYRQFLVELFRTQPELAGLISVNPKQLRLKQKTLAEGVALVEYLCGQNQLYLFLVTRQNLVVRVVDLPRDQLTARIRTLRRLAFARQNPELQSASRDLYRDLLGPVEAELQGIDTLGVLPTGPLHYLPFQLLVDDSGGYLVDRFACINLCEESFLTPSQSGPVAPQRLLLLGNPDGTLRFAEEEVRRIAELYPGSQAYVREEARKELVARAEGYQGLHIASHGILDSKDAQQSYIQLASERLTLKEIWGLDLRGVELVTLSACQTALGESNPGDDMISLENAFVFAGAHAVVASLWKVDDAATGALMVEFYRQLKSETPTRALQKAQQAVRRQYPEPYYWAPFVLIGPAG